MYYKLYIEDGIYLDSTGNSCNLVSCEQALTPEGLNVGYIEFNTLQEAIQHFNIQIKRDSDMAYIRQNTDFTTNIVTETKKLLDSIEEFKSLKVYYASQPIFDDPANPGNKLPDATVIQDGITVGDISGVITSMEALDTFLTSNWHYTNLNKIR